jgi:CDP-paratose 2-epimerase
MSLAQLSTWCRRRFGSREVGVEDTTRPYDIPWMVLDYELARQTWQWKPVTPLLQICEEIACHAEMHPEWLQLSNS